MYNKYIRFSFLLSTLSICFILMNMSNITEAKNINTSIKVNEFKSPTTLITLENTNISFVVDSSNSSPEQNLTTSVESNTSYLFGLSSSNFNNGLNTISPSSISAKISNINNQQYSTLNYNFKSFYKSNYDSYNKNTTYNLNLVLKSNSLGNYTGKLNIHVKPY